MNLIKNAKLLALSLLLASQAQAIEVTEVNDIKPQVSTETTTKPQTIKNVAPKSQKVEAPVAPTTNQTTTVANTTQVEKPKANIKTLEENIEPPKNVKFTAFISDKTGVWTTRGPGRQYKLTGQVMIGEKVQVLSEANNYYEIFTQNGKTVWIPKKSVQTEESNLSKVKALSEENEQLKYRLANIDSESAKELRKVSSELEVLKKEHQELLLKHAKQTEEVTHLTSENARLEEESGNKERTNQITWLTYGGIIAITAFIIGAIFVYLPRPRRGNKDYYY
ncbi:MAG: TIGR04211 family SH3 domain-containing protein [Succinivibrionaceae bacterium]|nr:TIGR04211 family SH3 domain-containing protein [Ruminobacter sp.]MDY5780204.1 TIGR04211 family SH3 domain-containing protein [Succinivibrionaceae bacterium]MEE1340238.1 TIGR04211 family SH3 domain-containing protein [Succinivibrionaceae bacterium]